MRTLVSLLAWLARSAGAASPGNLSLSVMVPGVAVLAEVVQPNRAGRLVPVPEEALEQSDIARSLTLYSVLWAAVAVIVLLLAVGYLRRRWKSAGGEVRSSRSQRFAGRDVQRK
jgi:hypothetical protein